MHYLGISSSGLLFMQMSSQSHAIENYWGVFFFFFFNTIYMLNSSRPPYTTLLQNLPKQAVTTSLQPRSQIHAQTAKFRRRVRCYPSFNVVSKHSGI